MSDSLNRVKLNHLLNDRDLLKTNIENKNIDVTGIDTITELDAKVNEIPIGYIEYDSLFDSVPASFVGGTGEYDSSIVSIIDEVPDSVMDYCYTNSISVYTVFSGLRKIHLKSSYTYDNTVFRGLVYDLPYLDTIEIDDNCDFSDIDSLNSAFANYRIKSFDFSYFSSSTFVSTGLYNTFTNCAKLSEVLNLDKCDFHLISSLSFTFAGCNLFMLDLSNTNLTNVTSYSSTFSSGLMTEFVFIPPSDVSRVSAINYMFGNCRNLVHLDLSSFVTSTVTNMRETFYGCVSLSYLDISGFTFTNVNSYSDMFNNVPDDCLIYVKDQDSKTWINSRFRNLTNVQIKEV